jgi:hypothetical protein
MAIHPDPRNSIQGANPMTHFFLLRACVRADAATLFSRFVELGSLRIFDAFDATLFDVYSDFFAMICLLSSLGLVVLPENVS